MNYSYRAIAQDGKTTVGEMEAPNVDAVLRDLKKQGLIAVDVSEAKTDIFAVLNKPIYLGAKFPQKELLAFTRELSTLIEAGLTIAKSLSVLRTMTRNKNTNKIISNLLFSIREGESFQSALKKEDGIFPAFYISMVGSGEASGQLDKILIKLSHYLERSNEVSTKIKSAMIYPCVLLVMVLAAFFMIITLVLPQFEPIFSQVDGNLPWVTEKVMGLSRFVNGNGMAIMVSLIILILLSVIAVRNDQFKMLLHQKILNVPIMGDLIKKGEIAKLHRMVGTLIQNGTPLVSAYSISIEGVHNIHLSRGLRKIIERLKEGSNISSEYMKTDFIPVVAMELTRVGEDTGRLGEMLVRTADIMDEDVKRLVDTLMALLVPFLTIFMGLIIAGMIASVLLGILSVNEIAF